MDNNNINNQNREIRSQRPSYGYQPPPRYKHKPTKYLTTTKPISKIEANNQPAFKLKNKTSMNLDGPGYALTLLLVGISYFITFQSNFTKLMMQSFRGNFDYWNGFLCRFRFCLQL